MSTTATPTSGHSHTGTTCHHCGKTNQQQQRFVIAAVLDKSGSMSDTAPEVISGFNKFLAEQQALPQEAVMHVTLFDTSHIHYARNTALKSVKPLDSTTYVPGGMTALNDAVASTISAIKEFVQPTDKVVVLITTDGHENSSHKYSTQQVRAMIEEARAGGWEFVFMGADENAWNQAQAMGISRSTTGTYANTAGGTKAHYGVVSANIGTMRASGAAASSVNWSSSDSEVKPRR